MPGKNKISTRQDGACLGSVIRMLVYHYHEKQVALHVTAAAYLVLFCLLPFFLLEVGNFLVGHINLNKDGFANGAFEGFSSSI